MGRMVVPFLVGIYWGRLCLGAWRLFLCIFWLVSYFCSNVGGDLATLTFNALKLNVTRFMVVNVLPSMTGSLRVDVPRTKRFVSTCTLNIYMKTPKVILITHAHPLGRVLLNLVIVCVYNGLYTTTSIGC